MDSTASGTIDTLTGVTTFARSNALEARLRPTHPPASWPTSAQGLRPTLPTAPILIFLEGLSFGHVVRPMVIARWLRALGCPIVIACSAKCRPVFAAEGFDTTEITLPDSEELYRRLVAGEPMRKAEDFYFEQDEALIRRLQPRLVISDFRFSAPQIARKLGIPSASITSASNHPAYPRTPTVPNTHVRPGWLPLALLDQAYRLLPGPMMRAIIRRHSAVLQQASRRHGFEPLPTVYHYFAQGDLCLLADHPELLSLPHLRPSDLYTGPLVWHRQEPLPLELAGRLDPKRRTAYVALGTQEALPTAFLEPYLRQLIDGGMQVIVSRSHREVSLGFSSDRLQVVDFVNERLLGPYIDVAVHPGGAGTTYQWLAHGVPMVLLPPAYEGHAYAVAVARAKLGCYFRPSRMKVGALVRATLRCAQDSKMRLRAGRTARQLSHFDARPHVLHRLARLCGLR